MEETLAADGTLIVVVGPTASGKTELALELARDFGGEVVNADSVQIYRRFDIGSGKPSATELRGVPYHLLDVVDPLDPMDAAAFAELAAQQIEMIRSRGRVPIVCGGTFLWVRALLFGLADAPPADTTIRDRHRTIAERDGRAALHRQLEQVDPKSAERLNPNDLVRVSRALEVHELTGRPMSDVQAEHGFRAPRYDARLVGVERTREELAQRIEARASKMLDSGWIEEVESLMNDGFAEARAMKSIGYRQVAEAVRAGPVIDRESLLERVTQATRAFVRKQRSWLRDERVDWIRPGTTLNPG